MTSGPFPAAPTMRPSGKIGRFAERGGAGVEVAIGLALVLGAAVLVTWFVLDRWGGLGSGETPAQPADAWGDFVVRTYAGHTQRDAIATYVGPQGQVR